MSLLLKRRSRSESRQESAATATKQDLSVKQQQQQPQPAKSVKNSSEQSLQQRLGLGIATVGGMGRRKTSAELISEAKLYLGDLSTSAATSSAAAAATMTTAAAAGGARLVSTRRPITPREPGRVLYGKVALAGRPPSAFSMRYLQNEMHKPLTPSTPSAAAANSELLLNRRSVEGKLLPPRQLPALPGTAAAQQGKATTPPTRNGALIGQCSMEMLIDMLKQHAGLKDCNAETVQHINAILLELYTRVRKQERNFKRAFILGGLYGLVECTAPRILLAVARVVLALRVTGSNLTGACKLIFKVARNEQHDVLFHENDVLELLIDGLGNASPLDEPEACIYAYGCIRFLTACSAQERDDALNRNWASCLEEPPPSASSATPLPSTILAATALLKPAPDPRKLNSQQTLVARLARHGAVELMILHLQMLNEAGATRRLSGPPLHTLYQLSAALRALAGVAQQQQQQRLQLQLQLACPHLIRAAEISMGELEVQANVVRTLSVLSEDVDCCETLHNYAARIGLLLGPCAQGQGQCNERLLAVLSRLGYMLGNILAKHESARVQYYHNDVAMEYLLNVLQQLSERTPITETLLDAQIKFIRVVANMSVNAEVGAGLGNLHALGAVLLRLLQNAACVLDKMPSSSSEQLELLHATLGALHNLCFYQDKQTAAGSVSCTLAAPGSLQSLIAELSTALAAALGRCRAPAMSTKVELARVLGNLTRNELARRCFCDAGGLPLMVQQLTRQAVGQDYELRTCAIGVLVNLLGDGEQRAPFLQLRGSELLALLLRGALEQEDWFLANIVCQALWNLLIDAQCVSVLCHSGSILDEISDLLADYLDEERLAAGDEANDDELDEQELGKEPESEPEPDSQLDSDASPDALWEDFALVATDLLERIQNNFDRQQHQHQQPQRQAEHIDNDNDDNDNDVVFIEEM